MSTDVVCPECGRMRSGDPWIPCPGCGRTRAQAPAMPMAEAPSSPWPAPPAKPSTSRTAIYVVLGLGLLGCLGFAALVGVGAYAGYKAAGNDGAASTERIESSDGLIVVHPYGGLMRATNLHQDAQLQLQNPLAALYLLGFSEAKDAFEPGFTLASYGDLVVSNMSVENAEISPPSAVTVGGRPGLEYRISGVVSHMRIVYLVTVAESESHFHQLVGWTLAPRETTNAPTLRRIAREATVRSSR